MMGLALVHREDGSDGGWGGAGGMLNTSMWKQRAGQEHSSGGGLERWWRDALGAGRKHLCGGNGLPRSIIRDGVLINDDWCCFMSF
jgi:hypothetical protein